MRIAYFVHDLSDAAAARRVEMLKAGGAELSIAGFRRGARPRDSLAGVSAMDLGETFDGALKQRARLVAGHVLNTARFAETVRGADLVLARNLEMLAIASAARRAHAPGADLAYECLDIHRAMVGAGPASLGLRLLERRLMRGCSALIVSAPAFVTQYFEKAHPRLPPVHLVENKVLNACQHAVRPVLARPAGPPWRIGWFGMLRCRRSVGLLCEIARRAQGSIEVVIRGRPSPHTLQDLEALIADAPHVSFEGAYRPDQLAEIYGDVHFMWSVDYADEGRNSDWLLPNRIYEGNYFGVPNIAERSKATGAWLAAHDCGLLVEDPVEDTLQRLTALDEAGYRRIEDRSRALDTAALAAGPADCRALVRALSGEAA